MSAVADMATVPKEYQQEIVARGERKILDAAMKIRAEKAEKRRVAGVQNLAAIGKGKAAFASGYFHDTSVIRV